jgi:hypothetical protein
MTKQLKRRRLIDRVRSMKDALRRLRSGESRAAREGF